jgi:uncharacterized protein (DUF1919 family)
MRPGSEVLTRARKEIRARARMSYWQGLRLRLRARRALHGSTVSIISSNCVGARISMLGGNGYRSPTVNLSFDPDSFLAFVEALPHYLAYDVTEDVDESTRCGYPVGRMGPVTIRFMHFATFADAAEKWTDRARRVDLDNVVLTFTDDGATDEHVARFAALPAARKIMFAATARPEHDCVVVVPARAGEEDAGDLFTNWQQLEPVLKGPRLAMFR